MELHDNESQMKNWRNICTWLNKLLQNPESQYHITTFANFIDWKKRFIAIYQLLINDTLM